MKPALAAVVLLAACQQAGVPVAASGSGLVPAPGGLLVEGSGGREIGFGRAQAGALQSVAKVDGRAPRLVPCGPGREAFVTKDGLRLVFGSGRFIGWSDAAEAAGRGCA